MNRSGARALIPILALFMLASCGRGDGRAAVRVFAAASLTDVMEAFADSFRTLESGAPIAVNVGGSSLLARQIARGAEADLFVSAHPSWTDYLHERGRTFAPVLLPVSNRLVEIYRRGGSSGIAGEENVAVADPDHVPAGMYAREALICEGRWEMVAARIVPTLDVRAALAAVQTGSVSSAIVYASDALYAPELVARNAVSDPCQPRVRYTAAIIDESRRVPSVQRFLALMSDPSMVDVWRRHGFTFHGQL